MPRRAWKLRTVANVPIWPMKQNLAIIPIINKIDLPHADVALTRQQLEDILAITEIQPFSGQRPRRHVSYDNPRGHR